MSKSPLVQIQDTVAVLQSRLNAAEARLDQAEAHLQAFSNVDKIFADFRGAMEATSRTVDALIVELGADQEPGEVTLETRIRLRIRQEIEGAMKERQNANTKILEELVNKGALVPTDAIGDNSYVVVDFNIPQPDGHIIKDRVQMNLRGFKQIMRDLLLGKSIGAVETLDDGGDLTVVGVYDLQKVEPVTITEEAPVTDVAV